MAMERGREQQLREDLEARLAALGGECAHARPLTPQRATVMFNAPVGEGDVRHTG